MKIKDMKANQYFTYKNSEEYLKVWLHPIQTPTGWEIEATCSGDYTYVFNEEDEEFIKIVSDHEVFGKVIYV